MEKLDINNVIEAQEIKNLIRHKKNLLNFFEDMIKKINIQLNDEKPIFKIQINDTLEYSTSDEEDTEEGCVLHTDGGSSSDNESIEDGMARDNPNTPLV